MLPLNLRQPLVIEVRDDHGVGALELVAYRITALGERRPPVVQRTRLGGNRAVLARPLLDLSSWGLLPGDTVRYFARALDNAPTPASAATREYVLRMPGAAELRREAQQELEAMTGRLQELLDRAERAAEQTLDLERAAGERQELTGGSRARNRFRNTRPSDRAQFEDREQVRSALEEQMEMSAEAERARAELEAIAEAVREAGASDPQLQQDLAELMSLLEEAASAEMTEQLRQLSEGLESTGERESRDALEELASQQARFREQLEKSLEQLRRAATEQDLRATTEDARELAQREQALAEALREGTENALRARQQETLLEDARVLEQRMGQLEQRLEMLEETGAQKGVQGAQEEASRSQEAMERAQQELQDGQDAEAAADQAEQAHAAMARAAEELEAAQQDMSTQRSRELQEAIARAGEEALTLARRQTTIRRRMRGSGPDGMKEQLSVQAALLQGFRNMAANLEERTGGMSMEAADVWGQNTGGFRGSLANARGHGGGNKAYLHGAAYRGRSGEGAETAWPSRLLLRSRRGGRGVRLRTKSWPNFSGSPSSRLGSTTRPPRSRKCSWDRRLWHGSSSASRRVRATSQGNSRNWHSSRTPRARCSVTWRPSWRRRSSWRPSLGGEGWMRRLGSARRGSSTACWTRVGCWRTKSLRGTGSRRHPRLRARCGTAGGDRCPRRSALRPPFG